MQKPPPRAYFCTVGSVGTGLASSPGYSVNLTVEIHFKNPDPWLDWPRRASTSCSGDTYRVTSRIWIFLVRVLKIKYCA